MCINIRKSVLRKTPSLQVWLWFLLKYLPCPDVMSIWERPISVSEWLLHLESCDLPRKRRFLTHSHYTSSFFIRAHWKSGCYSFKATVNRDSVIWISQISGNWFLVSDAAAKRWRYADHSHRVWPMHIGNTEKSSSSRAFQVYARIVKLRIVSENAIDDHTILTLALYAKWTNSAIRRRINFFTVGMRDQPLKFTFQPVLFGITF